MRSAASLLEELRAIDESTTIEAKTGSKVDRSVLETVCAFSNEPGLGGGHLLLGVKVSDQLAFFGRHYEVVGVRDADKVQSDLATQCATAFNRPVRPQISVEEVDGRQVLVAYVPELAATEKPLYLSSLGLPRGAYRRVGATDQQGTDDDLIALYQGHATDTYDRSIVRDALLTDLDPEAIRAYRELRRAAHADAEELTWSDDDLLRALSAVADDGGTLRPTVAGMLLFGTSRALRRTFPMMRIDYVRVPGHEWVKDPDRRFDTVEIRAPLLIGARRAITTVLDDLPKSFRLEPDSVTRTDEPALPVRVLREAIVNAVMHRSYRIHGPIQIIRYANRIEVRNPGHSIKSDEQLGEPGSETRNPYVAAVLHEVHLAETKGSGIRAMRELMQQHDLMPPTFESSRQPDQFVATFLFHHLLDPADLAWLRALTHEKLSDEEVRALVFVRELGAIDNASYRAINRAETLQASAHLRRLRDLKLLDMKGSGSRTYYVPSTAFRQVRVSAAAVAETHNLPAETHNPRAETHNPPAETHNLDLPAELRDRIARAGKRPSADILRGLILDLCRLAPRSSRELAKALGREARDLTRTYLKPMLEAGQLVYTIPDMPNHPDQRYAVPPLPPA